MDYYSVLNVNPNATDEQLKKSYHRLAMIWHPDKNSADKRPEAEDKFKNITEAYDVLSDPQKRQIYDRYGVEAIKSGLAPPSTSNSSTSRAASNSNKKPEEKCTSSFGFTPRDASEIFAESFTKRSRDMFCDSVNAAGSSSAGGGVSRKVGETEYKLPCTLEELYQGASKNIRVARRVVDASASGTREVAEILTIDIEPGWKKGTKITFPEMGNQEVGATTGDIIFVVKERPHTIFTRKGDDLLVNQEVSLLESLTGKTLDMKMLDGKNIQVPVPEIIKPGYVHIVANEGMPISKQPGRKGNLKIKFDVRYPPRLTSVQKSELRRVLGGSL